MMDAMDYARTGLYTRDGGKVVDLDEPSVAAMAANGQPPEVICWGSRFFRHDATRPDELRYVEVLCWFARVGEPPVKRTRNVRP